MPSPRALKTETDVDQEQHGEDETTPVRRGLLVWLIHPGKVFRDSEFYGSVVRRPPTHLPGRATTPNVNFLFHVYPVRIPKKVLPLRATGRLGFISAFLFVILTISGAYLMFFYRPQTPEAFFDMQAMGTSVAFGQLMRNVHRWSAQLMVVTVVIHMIRVFVSGAYRAPRQFNWVIGIGLLLLTLFLSFTGYLLPWDQLALWAVTVGTNIVGFAPLMGEQLRQALLGGVDVGSAALLRFYVLHIYVLPLMTVGLLGVHLWRIRKDGFAIADREEDPDHDGKASPDGDGAARGSGRRYVRPQVERVLAWPHLVVRHTVVAGATLLVVLALGVLFDAPLQEMANANLTPPVAKAPWYFAGLQELLSYMHPMVAGVIAPLAAVGFLACIPYLDKGSSWRFHDRKVVSILFVVVIAAAVILTIIGSFFRGPEWTWVWPWDHLYLEL